MTARRMGRVKILFLPLSFRGHASKWAGQCQVFFVVFLFLLVWCLLQFWNKRKKRQSVVWCLLFWREWDCCILCNTISERFTSTFIAVFKLLLRTLELIEYFCIPAVGLKLAWSRGYSLGILSMQPRDVSLMQCTDRLYSRFSRKLRESREKKVKNSS